MAKPKTVEIQKGELRGECLENAVPAWERAGWTLVDTSNSESGQEPVNEQPAAPAEEAVVVENEGGDQ